KRDIIVIGASAGGVTALSELFAALPQRLPATIGVVLHRSASPGELVHVLGRKSGLPVVEPERVTPLKPGVIFLAPPDHHLLFERSDAVIQRGPKEHSTRPAIDPLFRSASTHYGKRVVGILLTGCGEDGVSGLIAISQASGITLAQDPNDAYMPYMPMNALRFDDVVGVFPLRDMAFVIEALVRGQAIPPRLVKGKRGVALA
ncbi:MAG: Two-component system, chemotaxis family, response regulator CheB, partial [Nitrospira sp.]|nr:Two-component system, chemotaxis family, response regulator CheB [Nitrospira sp.]